MAVDSGSTRRPRGQSRKGIAGRFLERISPEPNSGCWLWDGAQGPRGYGVLYVNGRNRGAHVVAYELFVGPVPAGKELDHKCRNPSCANPAHLEPVTHQENVRRGRAGMATALIQRAKTHCPSGHPYTADNIYFRQNGHRDCKTCTQDRCRGAARRYRKNRTPEEIERNRAYQREWMRQRRAKKKTV